MIGEIILIGTMLWAFNREPVSKPKVGDPDYQPPTNVTPEDVETYRITFIEDGVDKDYIWFLEIRMGALYSDGSGELVWTDGGYIVGNKEGTGFTTASASVAGTQDFKLDGTWYKDVIVYPTLDEARAATTNPPEDPSGPQRQPDEPKEPVQPTLPVQPDYGLGGGNSWGTVSW
jgi:hypothetical protein